MHIYWIPPHASHCLHTRPLPSWSHLSTGGEQYRQGGPKPNKRTSPNSQMHSRTGSDALVRYFAFLNFGCLIYKRKYYQAHKFAVRFKAGNINKARDCHSLICVLTSAREWSSNPLSSGHITKDMACFIFHVTSSLSFPLTSTPNTIFPWF